MYSQSYNSEYDQVKDTDSLAEDSVQQRYQDYQDANNAGFDNNQGLNNGYDFLIDEDYQNLKAQQEQLTLTKWKLMGEKLSLSFLLKEVLTQTLEQNSLLNNNKHYYPSKSGSSDIRDLTHQLKSQMNINNQLIRNVMSDSEELKREKVRDSEIIRHLEYQIQRWQKQLHSTIDKQDKEYIEELELQIQETRKQLLEKKLKVTDQDEELTSLRKQLQSMELNFKQLEEQKKELDDLVIRVSQDLRTKDLELRDFNYQLANDKDHLARQVELLKKEVQEERERNKRLEVLESDLIHKAEVKENENTQLKLFTQELEDKLQMKSEAIEKAQKVIEKLNDELDRVTNALGKVEAERDQIRSELKESSKRVVDFNKQLTSLQTQHQVAQQQVSTQLRKEIEELKEALRQYQQQFDDEKRMLTMSLRDANEDKYKLHIEKEKTEMGLNKQVTQLQQQMEEQRKQHELEVKKMQQDHEEEKENLQQLFSNKEEQAQSQIKYLHRRLKEVGANEYNARITRDQTGKTSYLKALKLEFETVANEMLNIRQVLKQQCQEQNITGIPAKLKMFEDFRDKVLKQLEDWEIKAEGIATLSQRYERELDEQKKLFMSMRQMLKDKDQLILNIQKQVKVREAARDNYVNTIKKELERQSYLIRGELLDQFKSTQQTAVQMNDENHDLDRRFQSFKQEYMQLLEDRDQISKQNLVLKGQVETLTRDINNVTQEHQEFCSKVRQTLSPVVSQHKNHHQSLLADLEQAIDELRVRRDEVISYRSQLKTMQEQHDQDKQFLQQKVQAVEDQLTHIQKANLSKEEEIQVSYLQKETKYMNEVQKLQSDVQTLNSSLQTRERQLKKLQQSNDDKEEQIQQLQQEIEQITKKLEEFEIILKTANDQLQTTEHELQSTQHQLQEKNEAMKDLEASLQKLEDRQKYLKESLLEKELELQRERELNLQLQDEKYQAVNECDAAKDKVNILERENQNLYKDLVVQKERVRDLMAELEQSENQRLQMQRTCEQMTEVVTQVQDEVSESQRAVEQLNTALEKMKRKYHKAKELKHQIRMMKAHEQQLSDIIDSLRRQLHPSQNSISVQTDTAALHDLLINHEDFQVYQQQLVIMQRDNEMLQEAIGQRTQEIDRLIAEKRDLEELVDQQNQSIKQIRLNNTTGSVGCKENVNMLNTGRENNLYTQILQEKENYIMRLEQEICDMRKEIDNLKDKLISYEIGNLSFDKSLGGGGGVGAPVIRSHQNSQYKNYQQGIKPFKGTMSAQNSINLRDNQMYNATQGTTTTNYQTLQANNINDNNENTNQKSLNKSLLLS